MLRIKRESIENPFQREKLLRRGAAVVPYWTGGQSSLLMSKCYYALWKYKETNMLKNALFQSFYFYTSAKAIPEICVAIGGTGLGFLLFRGIL